MTDFTSRKTHALVMAGGQNDEELHRLSREKARCFINIGGQPIIEYVLDSLRGSSLVGDVTVVGNPERLSQYAGKSITTIIPERNTLQENFFNAMEQMKDLDFVLVSTADIPLISTEIIDNLISLFSRDDAEIYYPVIPVNVVEAKFPGGKRTVQKLREGEFTGGNIFMLKPAVILDNRARIDSIIEARKSKLEMIKLFGLGFVFRYLTRNLDLKGLEAKAGDILNAKLKTVQCPHAEVGFDIDKADDYKVAMEVIRKRETSGQGGK